MEQNLQRIQNIFKDLSISLKAKIKTTAHTNNTTLFKLLVFKQQKINIYKY